MDKGVGEKVDGKSKVGHVLPSMEGRSPRDVFMPRPCYFKCSPLVEVDCFAEFSVNTTGIQDVQRRQP